MGPARPGPCRRAGWWNKTYLWRGFVKDANGAETASPRVALLTVVPQPEVTSHLAGSPYATHDKEFDPQVGNFSTTAVDASVATVGPELTVVRTYNSLDPRKDTAFGAGWVTRYDTRLVPDGDGSGNVVVTYPDGQQVRFGKNPDGTFAAPQGRFAQLTVDSTTGRWRLLDKGGTTYEFSAGGLLVKVTDAAFRQMVITLDSLTGRPAKATSRVSGPLGGLVDDRSLTFTWTGNHVTSVRTDAVDGRTLAWSYTYNGDLLSQVCAPDSSCTQYEYATGSHYRSAVLDSKPESYWRLGEPEGTAANSEIAVNLSRDRGTYSNVTLAAPAGLAGTTDTAASFNGSSSQLSLPAGTVKKSRDVAVELWFKIPAGGLGGPLLGYQDKPIDTTPTVGVPLVYVGANDHKLHGQFWNGRVAPITASTVNVNDGRWHHAVLSANGATQTLYLDGQVAGTLANQVVDHTTLTYNQVGVAYATTPGSWPGWGTAAKQFFAGTIDEVALYQHPLGPATVKAHFQQATAAASQLTKVTLPSGKTAAEVTYDVKLDRVDEYTDRNGGTWQVGAPTVYGDDTDLRRAIQVLDPGGRPYFYEYDALAGRIIRSGAPTALSLRDEDRPGDPATSTTTTSTTICSQPDPGDPTFCTTPPSDTSGAPEFIAHSADGVAIRAYAYDDRGFPNVITDENGDAVTLGYDDRGNVTSVKTCRTSTECHTAFYTYPTTLSVYDPRHDKPLEFRDARSASAADNTYKTGYTYTTAGNLATQTNPDGGIVRHSYTSGIEAAAGGGYMPAALVATTTDARSGVTRYAYDRSGDLAQVTEQSELVTRFTYDALGRVTSRTEVSDTFPAGVTTTYTYDDLSRLTSVTEPATTDAVTGVRHQRKTVNSYDVDGNLARTDVSDLLGGDATRSATFDYNDHNQLERVTDALGNETSYGYDLFGNLTSMVDAGGNRFGYGYTARNKLAEVRLFDWDGDPPGAPGPSTDGYIVLDSYAYDFAGRQVRHTDAMGHERILTYYQDDLLKDVTLRGFHNPDGSTRDLVLESDTYDGAGNLTRQVTGNGTVVTQQTVNPAGQVDSVTVDPSGLARRTAFGYDLNGNVTRVSRSGNASNVNFPLATQPEVVDYTYDLAGRQTRQTASTGTDTLVTSYDYDQRSLPVATTDPRGNAVGADKAAFTTTFAYDELGRQVRVEGPPVAAESGGGSPQTVHSTVLTGYDTFDEPVAVKDPLGNVTSTTYDLLGQVVQTSAPTYTPPGSAQAITPTVHARYDALGNVLEVTDPRGNATRYTYDRLNRMATRDEPATTNTERAVWNYTYTRLGDVLSVTDPTGARLETTYDDLGRTATLTEVERRPVADNFTTRYRYDDADNLTQTIAPSGAPTDNVYDAVGELTRTTDPAGVITQLGYDFAGRQVRVTDGLGRTARAAYDLAGRLVSESDLRPDGSQVRQQTYGYDLAGNLTTATDPLGHPTTYTYDAANQLVKQVEPTSDTASITTTFGYDAAGDKTRFTDGRGNSTVYTLNSLGLPESVIEPSTTAQPALADRTWTVSYDAAGNPGDRDRAGQCHAAAHLRRRRPAHRRDRHGRGGGHGRPDLRLRPGWTAHHRERAGRQRHLRLQRPWHAAVGGRAGRHLELCLQRRRAAHHPDGRGRHRHVRLHKWPPGHGQGRHHRNDPDARLRRGRAGRLGELRLGQGPRLRLRRPRPAHLGRAQERRRADGVVGRLRLRRGRPHDQQDDNGHRGRRGQHLRLRPRRPAQLMDGRWDGHQLSVGRRGQPRPGGEQDRQLRRAQPAAVRRDLHLRLQRSRHAGVEDDLGPDRTVLVRRVRPPDQRGRCRLRLRRSGPGGHPRGRGIQLQRHERRAGRRRHGHLWPRPGR